MKTATKQKNQTVHTNTIESIRDSVYTETTKAVKHEATATVDSMWKQLLGSAEAPQKMSGDLQAGEAIDFSTHKKLQPEQSKEQPKNLNIAAGIDYRSEVLHGERRISKETEQLLSQQIQEITSELRQLVNASQELAVQFKDVAGEQRVTKPGKYHVSLFQFILTIVKQARMKVENSSACLSIAKGKKKKQGYWDLFAQQGTSFAMNNERAIATQAG